MTWTLAICLLAAAARLTAALPACGNEIVNIPNAESLTFAVVGGEPLPLASQKYYDFTHSLRTLFKTLTSLDGAICICLGLNSKFPSAANGPPRGGNRTCLNN